MSKETHLHRQKQQKMPEREREVEEDLEKVEIV